MKIHKNKYYSCYRVLGVGKRVDRKELWGIASHPQDHYTFQVDDYNGLESIIDLLAIKACTGNTKVKYVQVTQRNKCNAPPPDLLIFSQEVVISLFII